MLVVAGGLTLVVVILCFWVGGKLARSKGREVLPWSLVSALLPGIGLLVLAVQSSRNDIANLDTRAAGRGLVRGAGAGADSESAGAPGGLLGA